MVPEIASRMVLIAPRRAARSPEEYCLKNVVGRFSALSQIAASRPESARDSRRSAAIERAMVNMVVAIATAMSAPVNCTT